MTARPDVERLAALLRRVAARGRKRYDLDRDHSVQALAEELVDAGLATVEITEVPGAAVAVAGNESVGPVGAQSGLKALLRQWCAECDDMLYEGDAVDSDDGETDR